MKWGEPFIGCPVASPDGFMCYGAEGHDGSHYADEWENGELTGGRHIWVSSEEEKR